MNHKLTNLHRAPGFNLHCSLQHLSELPAPTSHSSFFSTNELPQKLPDGAANAKPRHVLNHRKCNYYC